MDTLPEDLIRILSRRPNQVGDVIASRYRLIDTLGDGAMGCVFVAENLAIRRRVAVKVLKVDLLADAYFRQRFQKEAEAIAAIDHRNVVRFFDLIVGDPTFLVMEYLPGPTLAQVLKKEKRLPLARALSIATRLCWGLEAAHRAGVIHRDIKPANIILTPDPEIGEEPKLIDFGLAKVVLAAPEDQPTRSGQIVGTPYYMSPEQIANLAVDARSDVYGLGCVLYHMVAGQPPFGGVEDVQILYQHIQTDAPPIRRHDPGLPLELELVLRCALAKNPQKRFGSMREMVAALAKIGGPQPAVTSPDPAAAWSHTETTSRIPPPAVTASPSRRLWWGVALVCASALGALAAWGITSRGSGSAARGLILVTSRPPGASITLDGKLLGAVTPHGLTGLSPGSHTVRLSQPGLAPVERLITLAPGEQTAMEVALPPVTRPLFIETNPSGATVFLDRRLVGTTPLTVPAPNDDFHELVVEKTGYLSIKRGLKPDDTDERVSFTLEAQRQPRGTVIVNADWPGEVSVDGIETGLMAPTIGIDVSAGAHTVELRDRARSCAAKASFTVGIGETARLTLGGGECRPVP